MKTKILILALALLLAANGVALANGGPTRSRWVLSGGASGAAGTGGVAMRATLGQPVMGIISAGDITLGQGFWLGGAPAGYKIYLPLVVRS